MGYETTAQAYASVAVGRYNTVSGSTTSWTSTDPVFVVGNGSSSSNTSDAFVVYKDGTATVGGVAVTSDARLKKDVEPLGSVLARLINVRGVTYEFKDQERNPGGKQIGVVAQEVQKAFPELVRERADGYLSMSYGNFTAVLLEAVKEQQEQIETLRKELESGKDLEARLARLEALLSDSDGTGGSK